MNTSCTGEEEQKAWVTFGYKRFGRGGDGKQGAAKGGRGIAEGWVREREEAGGGDRCEERGEGWMVRGEACGDSKHIAGNVKEKENKNDEIRVAWPQYSARGSEMTRNAAKKKVKQNIVDHDIGYMGVPVFLLPWLFLKGILWWWLCRWWWWWWVHVG